MKNNLYAANKPSDNIGAILGFKMAAGLHPSPVQLKMQVR